PDHARDGDPGRAGPAAGKAHGRRAADDGSWSEAVRVHDSPCHSEARSAEESVPVIRHGRRRGRSFAALRMTVGGAFLLTCSVPAVGTDARPPLLRDVGIEQRLGQTLPLDAIFQDESGRAVRLAQYFGK